MLPYGTEHVLDGLFGVARDRVHGLKQSTYHPGGEGAAARHATATVVGHATATGAPPLAPVCKTACHVVKQPQQLGEVKHGRVGLCALAALPAISQHACQHRLCGRIVRPRGLYPMLLLDLADCIHGARTVEPSSPVHVLHGHPLQLDQDGLQVHDPDSGVCTVEGRLWHCFAAKGLLLLPGLLAKLVPLAVGAGLETGISHVEQSPHRRICKSMTDGIDGSICVVVGQCGLQDCAQAFSK
mmetsp:Transcript_5378/g.16048  ORF Transcript_5378/g.16048 Transcript_5378/m.16048 type:complete len:241 (-) Transcript_5378:726-1448(-)